MSNMALVPAGSVIERVYYTIPITFTIGDEFETWSEAVIEARRRFEIALDKHRKSMDYASEDYVEQTAKNEVQIALRWFIRYPDGGSLDIVIERHKDVTVLRTLEEVGTLAPR